MSAEPTKNTNVVPFCLKGFPSLIEKAWPTSKISAEVQKERKAGAGQTLTGLGSYWKGRKPLILTRACILASLMPATDNLRRDVAVFEKVMGIDDEAFGRRYNGGPTRFAKLFPQYAEQVAEKTGRSWIWLNTISAQKRQRRIAHAFSEMPYDQRLDKVRRPEEVLESDLLDEIWSDVNSHLGTSACSVPDLVEQLGIMRYGRKPLLADTFSGSGSIPFEAARIGCDVIASDLNPVACMLTWACFNIVGASSEKHSKTVHRMREIANHVDKKISEMGVEHDEIGNRSKLYLYCTEIRCPRTGWMVPLSPTWVISNARNTIARLIPNPENKTYDIEILNGVSDGEVADARVGTLRDGRVFHQMLSDQIGVSMREIRGDFQNDDNVKENKLRHWKHDEFRPRDGDIFQERLYAILWMDGEDISNGKANPRTWFSTVTIKDIERDEKVAQYVADQLSEWQRVGVVSDMKIEPGINNSRPIKEKGWTYWHHLFSPRQILYTALVFSETRKSPDSCVFSARFLDWNSKLCRYGTGSKGESVGQTFYNQVLNTFPNYGVRSFGASRSYVERVPENCSLFGRFNLFNRPACEASETADIYFTDPPYADAVQYDEITEFFIAWIRNNPPDPFNDWIWDSRRSLAIKGGGQEFKTEMIDTYRSMSDQMNEDGLQIVQFTHQDANTWSDMAQIFWGAGLQVVQDWYVSTETMTELKKGGYVQGTHIIVLRKRHGNRVGYQDEIVNELHEEVERQIQEMTGLNQKNKSHGDSIFTDADIQMAGYAAAMRVLTSYTIIDGVDMLQEAHRPRGTKEKTIVNELIEYAAQTANGYLVPRGLDQQIWLDLNGAERFYLKMMEIEQAGQAKLDQFQNFAKAFRVGDYDNLMESNVPNNAKLKTAKKLRRSAMREGEQFGRDSIVRLALRGIWRIENGDETENVLEELRDLVSDYTNKRSTVQEVATYIATMREDTHASEASAARVLSMAIKTERI